MSEPPYQPERDGVSRPASITCPRCGLTSYNRNDVIHRFCGQCGFHDDFGTRAGREPAPRHVLGDDNSVWGRAGPVARGFLLAGFIVWVAFALYVGARLAYRAWTGT